MKTADQNMELGMDVSGNRQSRISKYDQECDQDKNKAATKTRLLE